MGSVVQLGKWLNFQSLNEGAGTSSCPFDMYLRDENDNYRLTIHPGTVNQIVPNNYFTGILIPRSGLKYIYLEIFSPTRTIESITLNYSLTAPEPVPITKNSLPGSFKILIGLISGRTIYKIATCNNYTVEPSEKFQILSSNPSILYGLYDYYYTWVIFQ